MDLINIHKTILEDSVFVNYEVSFSSLMHPEQETTLLLSWPSMDFLEDFSLTDSEGKSVGQKVILMAIGGILVIFSGPIMVILVIALVLAIITAIFTVLLLILSIIVSVQTALFLSVIGVFVLAAGVAVGIGALIYFILDSLGYSSADVYNFFEPFLMVVFGIIPISILMVSGIFFSVLNVSTFSLIFTLATVIVAAILAPFVGTFFGVYGTWLLVSLATSLIFAQLGIGGLATFNWGRDIWDTYLS